MSFKDYCRKVLNEETDIISVKAKLDAKKRGLKHQSHNVWKDKGGQEYNWNKMLKRFERIENKSKEKHFEFTGKTKKLEDGTVLKQIRATKYLPIHNVKKGDVGGWVENPENLSGKAWIYGNAMISGNAKVSGYAIVSGNARISGDALVSGDARVSGNTIVSGNAQVSGNTWVSGDARISGDAQVSGDAIVSGDAKISENKIIKSGEYK